MSNGKQVVIQLPAWQALALCATMFLSFLGASRWVFGEVKDDIAAIRADISGIDATLEKLNDTLSKINAELAGLRGDLATQDAMIASLSIDLRKTMDAVQGAGIDIQAAIRGAFTPSDLLYTTTWEKVRADYGIKADEPLFIQLPPPER